MIIQSQFRPAFGLSNPHLQTLLPLLIKPHSSLDYFQQTLELDDGDFLDLSWTSEPVNGKPTIVVFHGLEGSIHSHYIRSIMWALHKSGWQAVLMHFRGCSGRPNRLPRSYHSGETGDARYVINRIKEYFPDSLLAGIGYSLGGNMLLKLQAEYGNDSPLEIAVSVCAPVRLDLCADRLMHGASRIYQRHLMNRLKAKCLAKADSCDYEKLIGLSVNQIRQLKTFWQFDDVVTAPLHGFKNVDDYYTRSSSHQYLTDIKKPALIIHSLDDPFMPIDIVPRESEISESVVLEVSRYGGHVGFVGGSVGQPVSWLPKRIAEALSSYLEQ